MKNKDKIILDSMSPIIDLKTIFSNNFLKENEDKLEICFYDNGFIAVTYAYCEDKLIAFGFYRKNQNGCFVGHYTNAYKSIIGNFKSHYTFIEFNNSDDIRNLVSSKIFDLFGVQINL